MSILTRDEILKEIKAGNIVVEPFLEDQVGPASIDLHIGNNFRRFVASRRIIDVTEDVNYEEVTELVEIKEGEHYLLLPGETVLGITKERIKLAPHICGWLEGRSRFARLGLLVHISSSFIHPGVDNKQVLEISNFSPIAFALYPGTALCQFIFQRTAGKALYSGQFKDQIKP